MSNQEVGGLILLKENLSTFLNCKVSLVVNPISHFRHKYSLDILENPQRSVYKLQYENKNMIILSCKVKEENNVNCVLGLILEGNIITFYDNRTLERIAETITRVLSDCYIYGGFRSSVYYFDKYLIKRLIINTLCKSYYSDQTLLYTIDLLSDLRTMTFENSHFSTGFILTRNVKDFVQKNVVSNRNSELIKLKSTFSMKLGDRLEKRIWRIADGQKSFFLFNNIFEANHMLVSNENGLSTKEYLDANSLKGLIYGQDLAYRTFGHNQCSITNSIGVEVLYIENRWRIRNYDALRAYLKEKLNIISGNFYDEYLGYFLHLINYCSVHNYSTILWVPKNVSGSFPFTNSSKSFFKDKLSITNSDHQEMIIRSVTSDGVSVFNHEGELVSFGNIVDISKEKIDGLKGTGETALKILSGEGLAIKTSSDGSIKLYIEGSSPILL
ncbi:hypothetical protein ACQKFM_04790 [Paenibacillus xylanexedens]|uniref:hypothetical protein n=1 Tax=Paenibacillus xylanexedens TaxID=528191 RepID=UPI003D027F72